LGIGGHNEKCDIEKGERTKKGEEAKKGKKRKKGDKGNK
jgi:hypothetical protein